MRFGVLEIVLVFAIILLVLGPKQLPKVTAAIKDSISSFKKNKDENAETTEATVDEAAKM